MTDSAPSPGGYEEYYLRVNPPTEANYRRKARGYERRFGAILDRARPRYVLDLGCGTGLLCWTLARRGYDVTGVDLNPALLAAARSNVPEANFVRSDAVAFAESCDRRFDVVFLLDLLEHIHRDRVVDLLAAVRTRVAPGGFVLVRTPNMNCLMAAGNFHVDWTHITAFTEGSLLHVARRAGFQRVEHCNQFRMQTFNGKVQAVCNAVVHRAVVWLQGRKQPEVRYRNLVARLVPPAPEDTA